MNWGAAFLKQAQNDLELYQKLAKDPDISPNHKVHYLQMATEKIQQF